MRKSLRALLAGCSDFVFFFGLHSGDLRMEARELPEPQPQAFELVLRIRHPSMDPEEISAQLQISAEHQP